jgi:hypothetical protein
MKVGARNAESRFAGRKYPSLGVSILCAMTVSSDLDIAWTARAVYSLQP